MTLTNPSDHHGGTAAPSPLPTTPLPGTPNSEVADILAQARAMVEPALRATVAALPPEVAALTYYHFGWNGTVSAARTPTAGGGKGVRAALALACARAVGGQAQAAIPAAAAIELMHNASLIQDDLFDGDTMRRHRPTVWTAAGMPAAVLAGDALFAAYNRAVLAGPPQHIAYAVDELSRTNLAMIAGQLADLEFDTRRGTVTVGEYRDMTAGKTAALLSSACALGAHYGDATAERTAALRQFGHHLGMAYQAIDDYLGIWGNSAATGKSHSTDLRHRKMTLPVVVALTDTTPAAAELAELYQRQSNLTDTEIDRATTLIEQTRAPHWTREYGHQQLQHASTHLERACPTRTGGEQLTALARFVTDRDT